MKQVLETQVPQRQERGFSLMPVGHDGRPLACPAGHAQEIGAGIYLTVDPSSGIALIEVNPQEKRIRLAIDGKEIMDVAQLARGSVLTMDGKDYAFLKYMDVYFNPSAVVIPAAGSAAARILPMMPFKPGASEISDTAGQAPGPRLSVRRHLKLVLPAALIVAAAMTLMFLPGHQDAAVPKQSMEQKTKLAEGAAAAEPVASVPAAAQKAPETLRDLMADESAPPRGPTPSTAEPAVIANENPAAIPVKPEPVKQVKPESQPVKAAKPANRAAAGQMARPAVQPEISAELLKTLTLEYEEAVLIRGYDRGRSVQILEKLRTKVPAGSALYKKIENALNG